MKSRIFILILNYKKYAHTSHCLTHLLKSDLPLNTKLIVIDNSQNPGKQKNIQANFPKIKLIKSPQNLGFAAGNNLGINYALKNKATHVLIINPDVQVPKKFLPHLLANFNLHPKVGLVAPALTHLQKGKVYYGLDGFVNWQLATPHHHNLTRLTDKTPRLSQFVTFACVLINVKVFTKVGLLDESYFMYFEDVDYCLTARQKGFKIYLDPKIVARHQTSSSFKLPTQKLFISFKSHLHFISKWRPFPSSIIPFLYTLVHYPYLFLLWTYHHHKYLK